MTLLRTGRTMLLAAAFACSFALPAHALRAAIIQPDLTASAVPALINDLKTGNDDTQMRALMDLQRVKPPEAAKEAIPVVISLLTQPKRSDYTIYVNSTAASTLGLLPTTPESAAALYKMALEENVDLARSAAGAVPVDDAYLPQLKTLMQHKDDTIRNYAIARLRSRESFSDDAVAILTAALDDSYQYTRITAAQIIAEKLAKKPQAGPALIAALQKEKDKFTRVFLVRALSETGGATGQDLPLLTGLLAKAEEDDSTRYNAARAIGSLGAKAAPAVPSLIAAAESDPAELTRGYAAEALGLIGPAAADAVPVLARMVTERGTTNYRYLAAEALGRIAPPNNDTANNALIAALGDLEDTTQLKALEALRRQDNRNPKIIAALKALNLPKDSPNAKAYLNTLEQLASTEGVQLAEPVPERERLLKELNDVDELVQKRAVSVLKTAKEVNGVYVPGLTKALGSGDGLTRIYALEALGKTGAAGKPAIGPIILMLTTAQDSGTWYHEACYALAAIGPQDEKVLAVLYGLLADGKTFAADAPAFALARTGKNGLPYLVQALDAPEPYAVYAAAAALATLPADTLEDARQTALPALKALLRQPDKLGIFTTAGNKTSDRIIEALKHIAPDDPELEQMIKLAASLPPPTNR